MRFHGSKVSLGRPVTAAVFLAAAAHHVQAADVPFRVAFEAASGQDVISIAIPDSDTLVFDGGSFYTQGRRINVVAAKARATDATRIGFFAPDNRPLPKTGVAGTGTAGAGGPNAACGGNGCNGTVGGTGAQGVAGDPGAAASTMVFDIGTLTGGGKIHLSATGQAGGQGQKGGKGGTGGPGGEGAQRSCGGFFGLDTRSGPGNGGAGGTGGTGGIGGTGGQGGGSGFLALSSNLEALVKSGILITDLVPAAGGPGGDPGDPGDPGGPGGMGRGNSCGGGGSGGNVGSPGSPGAIGGTGLSGGQGTLRYLASELARPVAVPTPGDKK